MKIGKKAKALAIGLAFTAAAGLATVRKAAADLITFRLTPSAEFLDQMVWEPYGTKLDASFTVDVPQNFTGTLEGEGNFKNISIWTSGPSGGVSFDTDKTNEYYFFVPPYAKFENGEATRWNFEVSIGNIFELVTRKIGDNGRNELDAINGYRGMNYDGRITNQVFSPAPAVPIPGSALLFGTGLAGLAARALKRRRGNLPRKTLG